MDKVFETLEVKPIKDTTLDCMNDLISDLEQYEQWFDNEEYCKEELQWLKGWSERVKEDLLELKEIKEAEPSEAMEGVDILYSNAMDLTTENTKYLPEYLKPIRDKIKQSLLKAQDQEKENEVLKEIIKSFFDRGCPLHQYIDKDFGLTIEVDNECSIMHLGKFKDVDLDEKLKEVLNREVNKYGK